MRFFLLTLWAIPRLARASHGDVALVPFEVGDAGLVQTTLERIGSGPGWLDEVFRVCVECSTLTLAHDPGLRSSTALESEANSSVFRDAVYWKTTFSVQDFALDTSAGNVLALAAGSDIFAQFAWFELCPRARLIALHKTGSPLDLHEHVCGVGTAPLYSGACTHLGEEGCIFDGFRLGFFDASQEKHACTGLLARADNGSAPTPLYVPTPHRAPLLDGALNLYEKQWYATFDGTTARIYPEHVARHTHSWQTFLALEMHLIFYTHFISDTHKDVSCSWTRLPLLFGNLFAACSAVQIYVEFNVPERLYNLDTFFRGWAKEVELVSVLTTLLCAGLAIVLALYQFRAQERGQHGSAAYKFLMIISYEMALCIPLTLMLMGGGRHNLLNLFFLFTITLVTTGTRIRDIVRLWKNRDALLGHKYDTVSLLVLFGTTSVYALLVVPGVWRTAAAEIFVLAPAVQTATLSLVVLFTIIIGKYTSEHETYYALEQDLKKDARGKTECPLFTVSDHVDRPLPHVNNTSLRKRAQNGFQVL
jgi:hypothetical protein